MTHENVPDFSNGNYERRSWVVFDRSYSYLRLYLLAARLPVLTSKLERLDCSNLLNSEHRSKLSTDYSSGERWYGIVEVQLVEKTRGVATKQVSVTTLHVSVVWAILQKIKLLVINRDSSMVFSVVVLLLKYNSCLCNLFWCLSSKNSLGWEFVYFRRYVFCWNLAKLVIFPQVLHCCCQQWSPWAIFTADK